MGCLLRSRACGLSHSNSAHVLRGLLCTQANTQNTTFGLLSVLLITLSFPAFLSAPQFDADENGLAVGLLGLHHTKGRQGAATLCTQPPSLHPSVCYDPCPSPPLPLPPAALRPVCRRPGAGVRRVHVLLVPPGHGQHHPGYQRSHEPAAVVGLSAGRGTYSSNSRLPGPQGAPSLHQPSRC